MNVALLQLSYLKNSRFSALRKTVLSLLVHTAVFKVEKTRIISALVALPLLIFVIVSGGMWTHIGIAVLGLVGMYEFNKAISKEVKGTHIIAYLFGLIYLIFIDKIIYTAPLFSVFTSLFTIALLVYSVLCYKKTNYVEIVAALFGFFYACFLLSHVYLVREFDHGKLLVWLAFISAFGCDTGAYFTGISMFFMSCGISLYGI